MVLKQKYILRELSKKYLSTVITKQPKRGFEVPLDKWVEVDLKSNIHDLLNHNCYSSNFVPRQFISDLLSDKSKIKGYQRAKIFRPFLP